MAEKMELKLLNPPGVGGMMTASQQPMVYADLNSHPRNRGMTAIKESQNCNSGSKRKEATGWQYDQEGQRRNLDKFWAISSFRPIPLPLPIGG